MQSDATKKMNGQEISSSSEGGSAEQPQNNGTSSILHVPRKKRPEEVEGSINNEDNTMSAGAVLIDSPRPIRDDRNNNNDMGGENKNDHETEISITAAAPVSAVETATSITSSTQVAATEPPPTAADDEDEDGAATLALMAATMFSPSAAERVKRNRRPPTKFVARPSKLGCVDDGAFLKIWSDEKKTTKKAKTATTIIEVGDLDSARMTGGVAEDLQDSQIRLLHKGDLVRLSPES